MMIKINNNIITTKKIKIKVLKSVNYILSLVLDVISL